MTTKHIPVAVPQAGIAAAGQASVGRNSLPRARHRRMNAEDGTRQLLLSGFWTMLVAGIAAGLTLLFGGVGREGAHSNAGWLSLMVAMMTMPFAILLLLLGVAKWLRNLRLSKAPAEV